MLSFGWSPIVRPLPSPLVPLVILKLLFQTIGIIVTCMFPSFFQFPSKVRVLILLFTFFQFYSLVCRDSKVDYFASSLFFMIIKSGLLAGIRWSVCMLKSHRSLCVSFCRTGVGLCIYHLLVRSNLLHSLIIRLMVSSLSLHSLHIIIIIFIIIIIIVISQSLGDSKSPPVYLIVLSILADLNNVF